mgnify:CR=1 FL=1
MASGLRKRAEQLFGIACQAADPARALAAALETAPLPRPDSGGVYRVVCVGKAALPMAAFLLDRLAGMPHQTLVVTNYENAGELPGAVVLAAGHPVPDTNGAAAAVAVERLLEDASPADRVIALISGGGSALLPAPVAGITLEDKAAVNRVLLANGFEITEMNLIRQQLSRLKGGGMLRASVAPVVAYILSDVIGDDLRVIASGPTVAPIGTRAEARALLQSRGVWADLPTAVRAVLTEGAAAALLPLARNILIGSNRKSLEAVADAEPEAAIVDDHLTGDVADADRAGRKFGARTGLSDLRRRDDRHPARQGSWWTQSGTGAAGGAGDAGPGSRLGLPVRRHRRARRPDRCRRWGR